MNSKKLQQITIFGKEPPPIGGVTIHMQRMIKFLRIKKFPFEFYDIKKFKINTFYKALALSSIAHLHSNNPALQFAFVVICKFIKTKSILTIHGNFQGYNYFKNILEKYSVILCDIPIVLNENSLDLALRINKKAKLLSAFIPPQAIETLDDNSLMKITGLKNICSKIFCTTAYDYAFDRHGNEVYGVKALVKIFSNNQSYGLIIADPSGNYLKNFKKEKIHLPDNICFLDYPHHFFSVIQISDCFIRNTSTDGDSIAVKEALFLGKLAITTNCIIRPEGVILVPTFDIFQMEKAVLNICSYDYAKNLDVSNGADEVISIYKKHIPIINLCIAFMVADLLYTLLLL